MAKATLSNLLARSGVVSLVLATGSLALAAVALTPAAPAQAYNLWCGKFAGTSPPIGFQFANASVTFNDRFREAADNWNSKDVPGTLVPDFSSDPEITVSSGSFASEDWWGLTSASACGDPVWPGNEVTIKFNYTTVAADGLTAGNIRRVAVHEIGHAYGLWHDSMTCTGDKKVMEQGFEKFGCSGTPPWDDDQDGVRARY